MEQKEDILDEINGSPQPPALAFKFLRCFCPRYLREEIEGDLIQRFIRDVKSFGTRRASRRFVWNVLRFFRPEILMRNSFSVQINPFYMVSHLMKIFLRTTFKSGWYSTINLAGLTVGIASCIFILLWIKDEISYDELNVDASRVYKVMTHHEFPAGIFTYDDTPGPLASALTDLPEIEASARLTFGNRTLISHEDKSIYQRALYTDASFFHIFTVEILSGDKTGRLREGEVIISDKLAGILFGDKDPIGKTLHLENHDAQVTAVCKHLGSTSSVQFDLVIPYGVYAKGDIYNNEWGAWTGGQTYIKLHPGADAEVTTKKIHENFVKPKVWVRWDSNVKMFLLPLLNLRLHGNFVNGVEEGGRNKYVIGFSFIAGFILVIACINYMNLATSRSLTRAREIGVRKIVGAARRSIIEQFLGESILASLVAVLLSLLLVNLLLPHFNTWTEKSIIINYTDPVIYSSIVALILITGIAAGGYPAFLLSSFKPLNVLKGTTQAFQGNRLRQSLVVFQFSLSVILILSAIVVHDQISFMRNKDLGFDREDVFYFKMTKNLRRNFQAFRAQAMESKNIRNVAQSADNPMDIVAGMVLADNAWPGKRKEDNVLFKYLRCDDQLLDLLNFTFLDGRNFSNQYPADSINYIINEEAVRQMNLKDPIGQYIIAPRKGKIVGVIKDFHSSALKGPIEPAIISLNPQRSELIFVRYEQGHLRDALETITTLYRKHEPDFPLDLSFMDETFGRQYQDEIMLGRLSACFTGIALFISGLGLFGLASFSAARRAKEIGIRKVMGATIAQMVGLLCSDYIKLVLVALGIALPISWWLGRQYLDDYAYKISLGITPFLITSLSVLVVAMLTVSYQSLRAAGSNPVRVLKADN
jgi:hypothetical protein